MPRRLTHATRANKLGVVPFLSDYRPCGMTNPMPALARAFEVLRRDGRKTPKLILLLTDGVFPDNERVLELIRRNNGKRSVVIHTFLYGRSSTAAEAVLQKIARENGGRYECIRLDE